MAISLSISKQAPTPDYKRNVSPTIGVLKLASTSWAAQILTKFATGQSG
jgi:hypothetical protein